MEFYFHSTKLLTALQGILVFKIMSILQILTIFALQGGLGFIFFLNSTKPPILFALQGVLDFKYGIYVHFTYQLKIFYKDYMLRSRILFSFYKTNNILVKKEVLGFNVGIYVHSTNLPTILALQGGLGFETKFIDC